MRTYLLTFFFLCFCVLLLAQTKYEVTANSFLNIRSFASSSAPVIGTIDRGGKIYVHEIEDGWAKIDYNNEYAYISSDYIRKVEENPVVKLDKKKSFFDFKFGFPEGENDVKWIIYVIVGLSVLLFIFRMIRGDDPLEDEKYLANWSIFLIVSILEIAYIVMGGNYIWFCTPSDVGWLWTVINFLIFGFVVYNQILCLLGTLVDIQYNGGAYFDMRWGLYSLGGGIVGGIITGIFFPHLLPIVLFAFLIGQVIQIVLIFRALTPESGWLNSLLATSVYLLGTISTIIILAQFIILLIIVLVGFLALYIVGKLSETSSSQSCKNCNHFSGGYCLYRGETIYSPESKKCSSYS